jgi:hypothetical protein
MHALVRCLRSPTFLPKLETLSVIDSKVIEFGTLVDAIDARRATALCSLRLSSIECLKASGAAGRQLPCPRLTALGLDGLRFGAGELAALRQCALPSLTALAVTCCGLDDEGIVEVLATVLSPATTATLRYLDVHGNALGGCSGLFDFLKKATCLEAFDHATSWCPVAMTALVELVSRPGSSLRSLTVRGTPGISGVAHARRLLVALKRAPAPLMQLRLIDCGFSGTEVRHASNLIAARLALGAAQGIATAGLHLDLSGSDVDLATLTAAPATFAAITRLTLSRCRFGEGGGAGGGGGGGGRTRGTLKPQLHPVGASASKLLAQGLTSIDLVDAALDASALAGLARAAAANRGGLGLRLEHVNVCENVKLAGEAAGKALADLIVACSASIRCVRAAGCRLGAGGVLACLAGLGVPTRADVVAAGRPYEGPLAAVFGGDPEDDDETQRCGVDLTGNLSTTTMMTTVPDSSTNSTERELGILHHLRPALAASPFYCGIHF